MISTVVVSYKRPELLRLTLESYLDTVTDAYELVVVDNGSCPEAIDICHELEVDVLEQGVNRFPGRSTNFGWDWLGACGIPQASWYFHRSDNDVEYLPGWSEEVERCFDADPNLGQLGLRTIEEEGAHPNVGGNCVVRSDVLLQVRWSEEPWRPNEKGEDFFYTRDVQAHGWNWTRVSQPCIVHRGAQWPERPTDPYYAESWGARGYW